MRNNNVNVLVGGAAGQGLAALSEILCRGLVRQGWQIVVRQDYMSRIRGGHNFFHIRVSPDEIYAPEEKVDLIFALNDETVELHEDELSDKGLIIGDKGFESEHEKMIKVPFDDLAKGKSRNMAGLGVTAAFLDIEEGGLCDTMNHYFEDKSEKIVNQNKEALHAGYRWAKENIRHLDFLRLGKPGKKSARIMLDGNKAIALGALSAGLKWYSFYPMTPSTSIGQTLAGWMDRVPIVVEQAEDEIAVINMALGASYAGAPAMVGTSGGGLALMNEAVSLAGASETPIVIVVAMRPGPATGMPTRTEQGDLDFVIHAGHGEFPRAVFAPAEPEQFFHLTRKAFGLAEKSQGPVFILTDQHAADCFRAVEPFEVENLEPVKPGADPESICGDDYKRYAVTDSGVSPRLIPGRSERLVVADSHEHYENGHMAEDAEVRVNMVNKRLDKLDILKSEFIEPELIGDQDVDVVLVCWGSTRGAAIEAADRMNNKGKKASVVHFSQVWPLVADNFLRLLEGAGMVVCIEQNATGQFARLLFRETGFRADKKVLRYDGRPMTAEYIVRSMEQG